MGDIWPKLFPSRPSAFLIEILKLPVEASACLLFAKTSFWRPDAQRRTRSASKLPEPGKHAAFTGRPKGRLRGKSRSIVALSISLHVSLPRGYKPAKSTGAPRFAFSSFTRGLPHIIANETSVYIIRSFPTRSICSLGKKK